MQKGGRMEVGLMLPLGMGALGDGGKVPGPRSGRWRRWPRPRVSRAWSFPIICCSVGRRRATIPPLDMPEGRSRGIWEAWTILSAVAADHAPVRLSPYVACTTFRNPALLAKMADTLDEVSDGRLVLGLGAGWHEPEFDAFGFPFDHRVSRFEEALQIIVPLLRQGHVDFQGRYYQARQCELLAAGTADDGPPHLHRGSRASHAPACGALCGPVRCGLPSPARRRGGAIPGARAGLCRSRT